MTTFQKAVGLNPNDHVAVGDLADGYRWSGDKVKAKATYGPSHRAGPESAASESAGCEHARLLGFYYAKNGDSKKGLEFIHRARSIDGNDNS